jgi:hypothetical protein
VQRYVLSFDDQATLVGAGADQIAEAVRDGIRQLFIFAHGWNNTPAVARDLFDRYFATVQPLLTDQADQCTAAVGVIWPSIRWADEPTPIAAQDPALSVAFSTPQQRQSLTQLHELLVSRPSNVDALDTFRAGLIELSRSVGGTLGAEDAVDEPIFTEDAEQVFDSFADLAADAADSGDGADVGDPSGGAAAFNPWDRIWKGAREALRATTYYTMKKRAGVIGERGLGPLVDRLAAEGDLRVHLIGHSFGGRLVAFALAGLADQQPSPVKSLVLLQAAFSHYAFADSLPFAPGGGALAGLQRRVDGPLVVTHTLSDLALAELYPKASLLRGQDTSAIADLLGRWAAMGHDGAQQVAADEVPAGRVGVVYPFAQGRFLNVDANQLIRNGRRPSGSHSDIVHPELGWLSASAAGIAREL